MNKNNYKRYLQTKEFAMELIQILRESNQAEYQASAIVHKLLDTIPGKHIPKMKDGWTPHKIATASSIEI